MNKKLLTLAVAAAIAAPGLASAEAIMYGKIHQSIDYFDVSNRVNTIDTLGGARTLTGAAADRAGGTAANAIVLDANGNPTVTGKSGEDFKGWTLNKGQVGQGAPRSNRIGVKGSEDLGNGLKAVYQIEFGVSLANENDYNIANGDRNTISMRNTFAGLAGGWGTLLVGRHDTPLKISTGRLDLFSDTMADYNGTVGFDDIRADNAIAYISPSWSGLQFAGAVVPGSASTALRGSVENINSDSMAEAYSLALIYKNGPFYASAAYEALGSELLMSGGTSLDGSAACDITDATDSCNYAGDDYTKWRIGLGLLDWNGFTLTGIYEHQDELATGQTYAPVYYYDTRDGSTDVIRSANGVKSQDLWQVQAGYTFGNMMVKAMYGSVTRDADRIFDQVRNVPSINNLRDDLEGDRSTWAVGFDYNFSKRTTAYALYTDVSDDNKDVVAGSEWSGFSLGLIHSF